MMVKIMWRLLRQITRRKRELLKHQSATLNTGQEKKGSGSPALYLAVMDSWDDTRLTQ